jgi:DNA helicase-2/ATP-dependent DNA helicase PcrA
VPPRVPLYNSAVSFYADLHIHSKYSRATSRDCDLENLAYWGRKKGIAVIGTGDFTHPAWFKELQEKLVAAEPGLFRLRPDLEKQVSERLPSSCQGTTRFMLSVEISTIYKKGDKVRKIHHLIYTPGFEAAGKIRRALEKIGNIRSDGRPILGLDSRHLLEIVLQAGEGCYLVPAHIWTPWFAVLGSKSGFDDVAHCYADLADHVFAVETGLSSDPEMNWKISFLDRYRLMSNSDAHSPAKLGREVNVFNTELDYFAMKRALETGIGFGGTCEFFPEEGKYHADGHRNCGVRLSPEESKAHHGLCPKCKRPLTLGVLYRVEELADRHTHQKPEGAAGFKSIIPLPEVISELMQCGPATLGVSKTYENLLNRLGSELDILNFHSLEEIQKASSEVVREAIRRMREGQVIRDAGYDGEYGRIKLFDEKEIKQRGTSAFFDCDLKPTEVIQRKTTEMTRAAKKSTLKKTKIQNF